MLDEIAYPFLSNLNGANALEWISNFIPHFMGHVNKLSMLGLKLIRVGKRGPR